MKIRKIVVTRETVYAEGDRVAARPVAHAVALAVIENPFAGRFVEDLSPLFDAGAELGERLMPDLVKLLQAPAVAYSKAAIVGTLGELEHGHALVHPKLGKPMRAAIGGGKAVICSNVKKAAAGTSIDMPFANKDNIWSFDDFGTLTIAVADAPLPNEVVVAMAISDGGRLFARVGKGPIT
jgi:amino acid synthesis protein